MSKKVAGAVAEVLKKLQEENESNSEMFSDEVREAMAMADKFSTIEPEPYILPLDALAGFPTASIIKMNKMLDI